MLRFCCNQRDVHFLRALSLRVLGDAINAHDDGILQAVAGVMAQVVPLDTDSDALESAVAGAPLGPVRLTASFLANRERVSLPFSMGGLAIRRWSPHAHAAYVAHWRQVLTSTQFSLAGIDADFCAFPAVTGVIEVATVRSASSAAGSRPC